MKVTGYNSRTSWLAAFACSVIGFLVVIPMRLAGYFFVVIIDHYRVDRKQATIPIVTFGVLRSLTGPIIGYLGQTFGLRATTVLGCLLAAIGVGTCYFAENILTVIICLGFIYGLGFGFGVNFIPEILKQHFIKDINMAIGTFAAGSCLSGVIMPPVLQALTNEYGETGMFLILSAIILNSVPAALILKDPKNTIHKLKAEPINELGCDCINNLNKLQQESKESHYNLAFVLSDENIKKSEVDKECNTIIKGEKEISKTVRFDPEEENISFSNNEFNENDNLESNSNAVDKTINERTEEVKLHLDICSNVSAMPLSKKSNNKTLQAFKLFVDPTFYLTMFVQSSHAFVTTLTWTVLIDFSRDNSIPDEKSLLFLMALPISEMFGNLCLNWITDREYLNRTKYCMACYVILGLDIMMIVWTHNFISIMIGVLVFGCFSGSLATTFPGMIFENFKEEQQSMALTSRYVLYAFFCVTKTPIIGYFRGTVGSYNWVFYCIAISCFLSSALVLFTPLLASRRNKKIDSKHRK